jgi:glycosyltransferase involved in cell wall biosynthesis
MTAPPIHLFISSPKVTGAAAGALLDAQSLLALGVEPRVHGVPDSPVHEACRTRGIPFDGGWRFSERGARAAWADAARMTSELCAAETAPVWHTRQSLEDLRVWLARRRLAPNQAKPIWVRGWTRQPACWALAICEAFGFKRSGLLLAQSDWLGKLPEARRAQAAWLPCAVDTDAFHPRNRARTKGVFRIGLLGRWKAHEDRGQRAFLHLLAELFKRADLPPWEALLLGRGEGRPALEALIAAHPARDRIRCVETSAEFATQVADLDAGVVWAVGADGTSRPAVELLASGVPIVCADQDGLRDLFRGSDWTASVDAGFGALCPADGHARAATVLAAWVNDPAGQAERREAARGRAEALHSLPTRGRGLLEFYARLARSG